MLTNSGIGVFRKLGKMLFLCLANRVVKNQKPLLVGLSFLPIIVVAQTNAVWHLKYHVTSTNEYTVRECFSFIERESQKVDKENKGLTILYPPHLTNLMSNVHLKLDQYQMSFIGLVDFCAGCLPDTGYRVFDRVAVFGPIWYRDVLLALSGRCADETTGQPITNFTIKVQNEFNPQFITIDRNGNFTCAIHHSFDYIATQSAIIANHDIKDPPDQVLEFCAPGYQKSVVSSSIYWAHGWGTRFVEVRMKTDSAQTNIANH